MDWIKWASRTVSGRFGSSRVAVSLNWRTNLASLLMAIAIWSNKTRNSNPFSAGSSAEAKEALEDEIDWDLGPFLEGTDEWTSVYTIEFIKKLAMAIEVNWQVVLAGISNG